jgi:hypothetical protein
MKKSLRQAGAESDDAIHEVVAAGLNLLGGEGDDDAMFDAIDVYFESVRELRRAHRRQFKAHRRRFRANEEASSCQ